MITRAVSLPLWLFVLLVLTLAVLILIVWSVKRRRRPNLKQGEVSERSLLPSIAQ